MIQVEQTKMDGLGGGNCAAACIASIFHREIDVVDVPCGGNYQAICDWTQREYPSLYPINVQWDHTMPLADVEPPTIRRAYWIATVRSPRTDGYHCVVMNGREMVWDPHPQRDQGYGECIGYTYWIVLDPSQIPPQSWLDTVQSW